MASTVYVVLLATSLGYKRQRDVVLQDVASALNDVLEPG